jgi:hypothetical protein
MSVVDGKEWERLKRFNVNELYKVSAEGETDGKDKEAKEPEQQAMEKKEEE